MGRDMKIAIYMRLSKEDKRIKGESGSIQMQRLLLKEYVSAHFKQYELLEFQDDGWSGTNFNRPGVTDLLNVVKESGVDCIIVKDFSRFSRDYTELGSYIDQVFPFMGVRFISVNDHYDSETRMGSGGDLDTAFKVLLYDLYSKDLSVKVKASLAVRKEQGKYVSANSPFGYEKDPDDRHMLLVEEDEASVVRRIFTMAQGGMTSSQIARTFNLECVKPPIQFKIEKGKTSRIPKGHMFQWGKSMICQVLRNEIYVGDMVYGKYGKVQVGGKKYLKPRNEWKIFPNHHEAIIDRELFEVVQKSRGRKTEAVYQKKHPLVGKLVCACCHKNLTYKGGTLNPYFYCATRYTNGKRKCVSKVNVMFLEQYLLYFIQQEIVKLGDTEGMGKKRDHMIWKQLEELKSKQHFIETKLAMLGQKKRAGYEQYALNRNKVPLQEEYCFEKMAEERICKEALLQLNEELLHSHSGKSGEDNGLSDLLAFWGLTELNKAAVDVFIQKIVVHDEEHMEIHWDFRVKEFGNVATEVHQPVCQCNNCMTAEVVLEDKS